MPESAPSRSRTVAESRVEMTELVLPEDTNPRGSIFGGRVLALIDKCAAVVAVRHARSDVLTVAMDSVEFHNAVRLGDIVVLHGRLNAVFSSSMEIEVEVHAEDPYTGQRNLTTRAFVTMVCVDPRGRPVPAVRLDVVDDADRAAHEAAVDRRRRRLEARSSANG